MPVFSGWPHYLVRRGVQILNCWLYTHDHSTHAGAQPEHMTILLTKESSIMNGCLMINISSCGQNMQTRQCCMTQHGVVHCANMSWNGYRLRRKSSQNVYQSFVHFLSCTLKELSTASHKQGVPYTQSENIMQQCQCNYITIFQPIYYIPRKLSYICHLSVVSRHLFIIRTSLDVMKFL